MVYEQVFNEMDFFAQVEEEQRQQEQIKEMERLELLKNLPRWESKPHQILRSNLKSKPKHLKYYEKLENLWQDGDFDQLCISLRSYVNGLSAFLYKGLKGYKFTYAECQSEVWLIVAEMIDDYDNETDIPFVYMLKHKVYHNRYQNIIEYVKAQCRRLNYTHKIQSIEHLKELGKDIPDRKAHLYFKAVEDKIDKDEEHKNLLLSQEFTEQEKMILEIWRTEPDISTRRFSDLLGFSQSTANRTVRNLKEKLAG